MPTTDKFAKKVVSAHSGQQPENDELLAKTELADSFEQLAEVDPQTNRKTESGDFQVVYVWRNILAFVFMHLCIPYTFYVGIQDQKFHLIPWHTFLGYMAGLGVTAGAHRLWSHSSYKAHWTVRLFLAFWFTVAGQNDIYEWCRDHRVHHKWSETDADPHNANRGFFFAHMGWLCCRKHPEVFSKGKTLPLDDLLQDPIVRFHKKYYKILFPLIVFWLPTYLTVKLFGELWVHAFAQSMVRYCFSLHITWLVNSAAHFYGYKPYNEKISPTESPVVIYTGLLGEGFHNYHHTFPSDYRASELGLFGQVNLACMFIELMAKLGLAWDLKKANPKTVEAAKRRVIENELRREKELMQDQELLKERIESLKEKDGSLVIEKVFNVENESPTKSSNEEHSH